MNFPPQASFRFAFYSSPQKISTYPRFVIKFCVKGRNFILYFIHLIFLYDLIQFKAVKKMFLSKLMQRYVFTRITWYHRRFIDFLWYFFLSSIMFSKLFGFLFSLSSASKMASPTDALIVATQSDAGMRNSPTTVDIIYMSIIVSEDVRPMMNKLLHMIISFHCDESDIGSAQQQYYLSINCWKSVMQKREQKR